MNDSIYLPIWRRALNLSKLGDLTPELVASWADERGVVAESIERCDVGVFAPTPSIVLTTPGGKACFPLVRASGDPAWQARLEATERRASLWAKMEWFDPPWVPLGLLQKMLKDTELCSKDEAIEVFDHHTSNFYTLPFLATCVAQMMPKSPCLKDFCPLIREAFLGFYSGSRASSIAALIPVMEGALTRIVETSGAAAATIPEKVNLVVNGAAEKAAKLYFDGMWIPREYTSSDYLYPLDERVRIFVTLRRWLVESFFCKTSEYSGATRLNRHLFAHGMSSSWQQEANFFRLVVALTTIGWVEAWRDGTGNVTLFFPEMDDQGHLLWQQAMFQAETQVLLKSIAEKRYHQHGRLVPELPTDNGALLRRALLADDCIKDLVRPLRDVGWSVAVGEPETGGFFIVVRASAGETELGIALLYSCATANEVYRKLAKDNDVILYRGAPYHQQLYAYGIDAHVGPVAGWQPPRAPA